MPDIGRFLTASLLLALGAFLSGCSSAGWTAAQNGDSAALRQVLAQPNHGSEDLDRMMFAAVHWGDCYQCVVDLLAAGAKPKYAFVAAAEGHERIARLLISRGGERGSGKELRGYWGADAQQTRAAEDLFERIDEENDARAAKAGAVSQAPAAPPPVETPPPAPPAELSPNFTAAERPDDLAVIVGVETYSDIAAKAAYAERDAESMRRYVRALGVPERNIVLLTGSKAVRSGLTKNIEGWLPRMAKPDSRVYFYFSGHGAPDIKTGQAYLVPWDGDPNFLDATAYPVARLYKELSALPVKQVLVALDSCFSGAGGRSVLASGARPLVAKIETGAVPANVTVLAASASSEISGALDDRRHGAFTYFLLEGLNAGKTTPKALWNYLTPRVEDEARRLNRDQTPQLQGAGDWPLR